MPRIRIIIGTDDLLVADEAAKTIGDGVGLETIDSNTSTNEEYQLRDIAAVRESILTPPFFDPCKVTWWKNANFLPGGGGKGKTEDGEKVRTSEAVKEALLKFAEILSKWQPGDNQSLVITAPRLLMTSVFAKTLKGVAEFKVFEALKGSAAAQDAVARAEARAASLGLSFERGVSQTFAARVGADERSIKSELEKLRDFLLPDSVVTAKAIEAITSQGIGTETPTWEITDAISARNPERALCALRKFEGDSGFAVMATTIIERQFRILVELKAGQEAGRLEEAAKLAGIMPWKMRSLPGDLQRWTLLELRTARLNFMKLRERCVSSAASADASVSIELLRALKPANNFKERHHG